jgi:isovaleryl-CoA dehydrogenase
VDDTFLSRLDTVVNETVGPDAVHVDRDGMFPRKGLDALALAGILGLTCPTEYGGAGAGLAEAALVIERLGAACGSTAMVVLMHYAALPVIVAHGPEEVRSDLGAGRHLTTLAFSEAGSRSHFWAPTSTATATLDGVGLTARKSWVTAAGEADSYVWSSRPLAADGPMSLWFVPSDTSGVAVAGPFDGLGLRGNASRPVTAQAALVPRGAALGPDGAGLDLAMQLILPSFLVLSAAFSVGLMRASVRDAVAHLSAARLEHLDQRLIDQPLVRADIGRMQIVLDQAAALLADTIAALGTGREDATLRLLQVKAAAAEAAITVTDLAMKACGGAAFRRDLGIERRFRDARAARVMAPTTDRLTDFVARVVCGLPLLDGS